MDFKSRSKDYAKRIEKQLEVLLEPKNQVPQIIHEAMRYSVFAGGKRLRPILTLTSGDLFGGSEEELINTACALEMIHTYSLIHDDHPDLDNDSLRRGVPTNHMVFGNAMAILAGDALLTQAFQVLGKEAMNEENPEKLKRRLQANFEIAQAAGSRGMIGGQVVAIISEGSQEKDPSILRYIHTHKTGDLIRASVRSGALIAGANDEELFNITVYAEKIGMAFQITDDILDVKGDQDILGKNTGSDEERNKLTYPSIYGLEKSEKMAQTAIDDALMFLRKTNKNNIYLEELANYILTRNN
jgi:geranylgeranyl diphosphate synthase type II